MELGGALDWAGEGGGRGGRYDWLNNTVPRVFGDNTTRKNLGEKGIYARARIGEPVLITVD